MITRHFGFLLPSFLKIFDADEDGKIERDELYGAVRLWVKRWRDFVAEVIAAGKKQTKTAETYGCDFNNDRECNVKDLSILLFYIGK